MELIKRARAQSTMSTSLYRWFSSSSSKPFLPDPSTEKTKEKEFEVAKANAKVVEAMESQERRKRRGTYAFFTPELRAKIGKFAAESGNKAAVEKFSRELGKPLSESTIHGFKKQYYKALKQNRSGKPVTRLEHHLRGRPGI